MDNTDTALPPVPPPLQPEQTPATPPQPPTTKRDELLSRVAAGADGASHLPKKATVGDPAWWRLNHGIPFLVLVLVAAAADYFCPLFCMGKPVLGFGTALGTLLFVAALLLLRKDYTRGEQIFLVLFALVSAAGQAVSGSVLNWLAVPAVCSIMLILPKGSDKLHVPSRTWWGFWLARRPDASKAKTISRGCLPLCISITVALSLFITFLIIFAQGNPVVQLVWNIICECWNNILDFLHLDMTFWAHALVWVLGILGFGCFTFGRNLVLRAPADKKPAAAGKTLLPHLPSFALIGVNAAFAIATSTDIMYLWFRRVPEGISQTAYLHHGALSIIIASLLAAALLLLLFRSRGTARQSGVARFFGYLLVLQTALLAVSVFMRLFFQIEAYSFTGQRVLAAECMLCGVVGIGLLLSYLRGGCFMKHLRVGLAAIVILFFGFNIQSPKALAGDLNMCMLDSHPHWKFETKDFLPFQGCFTPEDSLDFAGHYMQASDMESVLLLRRAAEKIRERNAADWRSLTVNAIRFRETADIVFAREDQKADKMIEMENKVAEARRRHWEAKQDACAEQDEEAHDDVAEQAE